MTTIAIKDGIMAADSTVVDSGAHVGVTMKLHRISCGIMGAAGDLCDVIILRDWLNIHGNGDKRPPERLKDSELSALLLCNDGRVICYEGQSEFQIEAPFQAIGTGFRVALGAMAAGASAGRAVEIACEFDSCSRGPVVTARCGDA